MQTRKHEPLAIAMQPRAKFRRTGLSLLEVVLALTILAVAAALLAQITKQATDNGMMSQRLSTAQMLCESKMSEVLAGAIPLTSSSWTQITDSGRRGSWFYKILQQGIPHSMDLSSGLAKAFNSMATRLREARDEQAQRFQKDKLSAMGELSASRSRCR